MSVGLLFDDHLHDGYVVAANGQFLDIAFSKVFLQAVLF